MQFEQPGSYQQAGGTYSEPLSRQRKGFLVFLLDQSTSMSDEVTWKGHKLTLAQMATSILNGLLVTVIENAKVDPQTGRRKNNCDILIYGYGDQVKPLLNSKGSPISVPDLANNPTARHMVRITRYDSVKGQNVTVDEEQPYWIVAHSGGNWTEMAAAVDNGRQAVERWFTDDPRHRLSFPPIVINITDGKHNGKNNGDPVQEAMKLQQLGTDDGKVLFFNCHITQANAQKLSFPSEIKQIEQLNLSEEDLKGARQLFNMSSIVPKTMAVRAQHVFNRTLQPGARGFMYNASPQDLFTFLSWGTRQSSESVK